VTAVPVDARGRDQGYAARPERLGIVLQDVAQALRASANIHWHTASRWEDLVDQMRRCSAMHPALQDGHTARPLQENAIRKSCLHSPQRARAKP